MHFTRVHCMQVPSPGVLTKVPIVPQQIVLHHSMHILTEVSAILPKSIAFLFLPLDSSICSPPCTASPASGERTPLMVSHVDVQTQAHVQVAMRGTQVKLKPKTRSIGVQAGGPTTQDAGAFRVKS